MWEQFGNNFGAIAPKMLFGGHVGPFWGCLGTIWEPLGSQFGGHLGAILSLGTVKMENLTYF